MLISKPVQQVEEETFNEMQKMMTQFLPHEQVKKFSQFPHLVEAELLNEAREPEIANTLKDLFDSLHEHNTPKLLKVLQGDKEAIFFAFKKQLQNKERLTKQEARILNAIEDRQYSLLTISLMKEQK